jgi:hypothetical protein
MSFARLETYERDVWLSINKGYSFGYPEAPPDQCECSTGTHTIKGVKPGQFSLCSNLCKSDQGPNSTQSAPLRAVALFPEPVKQPALTETNATCGLGWTLHVVFGLPPETTI